MGNLVIEKSSNELFDFDKSFNKLIIGTDEAGRGPGAGRNAKTGARNNYRA